MAGRRIRDEAEARDCVAAFAASGMARRAWAAAHGIDGRSLHAWELNLARESRPRAGSEAVPGRFVELVAARPAAGPSGRYRVIVGRMTIEVDEGFSSEGLSRLLRVVTACSA
jgi:hypothetical protein